MTAMIGIQIMQKVIIHQPRATPQLGYGIWPYLGLRNCITDQIKIDIKRIGVMTNQQVLHHSQNIHLFARAGEDGHGIDRGRATHTAGALSWETDSPAPLPQSRGRQRSYRWEPSPPPSCDPGQV